jgi:hypothetical protein
VLGEGLAVPGRAVSAVVSGPVPAAALAPALASVGRAQSRIFPLRLAGVTPAYSAPRPVRQCAVVLLKVAVSEEKRQLESFSGSARKRASLPATQHGEVAFLEVCTEVCTACSFPVSPTRMTHATMRFPCSHAARYGPGRSRTSARGFEVRCSIR